METNSKHAWSLAASIATALAIIWIAGSTVLGELYAPFKDYLKSVFTHHWIGKGVVSVALFAIALVVVRLVVSQNPNASLAALKTLTWCAVLGTLVITGYYFYADFIGH